MSKKHKTWSKYSNKSESILVPEYTFQKIPYSDLSKEEKDKAIKELGEKILVEFPLLLQELRCQLVKYMPIHPLCLLSYYFLTSLIETNKSISFSIEQFQVELLQALFLQIPNDEYINLEPLPPDKIESLIELINKITQYKSIINLANLSETDSKEISKKQLILGLIRTNTEIVRNWAYSEASYKLLVDIYSPVNEEIFKTSKIDILLLISFFRELTETIELRINEHLRKIREIMMLNDKKKIISKYIEYFPMKNTEEELLEFSRHFRSRKDFKYWLITHSDILLPDLFKIDLNRFEDCFSDRLGENFKFLLDSLSYEMGDLKDFNTEHLYLANPIWQKPFIKMNELEYYYPIPSMFQHSCFQLIENLVYPNDVVIKKKVGKIKSNYLEDSIERLFSDSFPDAIVYKNLHWFYEEEMKEYENDILVIIDNVFIIIEAKAGKFSDSSKRGSLLRIEQELNELIIAPAVQSKRFEKYIKQQKGIITLKDKTGSDVDIDCSLVRDVIRLSITLEFIPVLSNSKNELFKAGFISERDTLTTTMSLNALEIVLDLLPKQSEKIHYFSRRYEFEKNSMFFGDELDILVFYLETGFNIGESEFNNEVLFLQGNSIKLDEYYLFHKKDRNVLKPTARRTPFWNDVIERFEKIQKLGWTEMAYSLLNISYEDQIKIQEAVERQSKIVIRDWGKPKLNNAVMLVNGPPQRREIFVWFLYLDMPKEEREKQVRNIVESSMDKLNISKSLILGSNLSRSYYPYSFIAMLKVNDDDVKTSEVLKTHDD